ncbi:MAG: hypothetical protein E6R03_08160 [Hyphomicrobiaceae bacterium]|nr:MAG: hypothetical protein E6R03_08160 [Hyphomicrobiaceae bacterium]
MMQVLNDEAKLELIEGYGIAIAEWLEYMGPLALTNKIARTELMCLLGALEGLRRTVTWDLDELITYHKAMGDVIDLAQSNIAAGKKPTWTLLSRLCASIDNQ